MTKRVEFHERWKIVKSQTPSGQI